jgi:hypothetical protein
MNPSIIRTNDRKSKTASYVLQSIPVLFANFKIGFIHDSPMFYSHLRHYFALS